MRADGSFVTDGHRFARVVGGRAAPYAPRVRGDAAELRGLIDVRDAARLVLDVQTVGVNDSELVAAQRVLSERYDVYRDRYGPLNRYTLARTGRVDPETGEEVQRRIRPRMGGFRDDPDWPLVAALEIFDDETQTARKAPIFTSRVISPPVQRLGVDTPAEAVAVCMDADGAVTLERAAELLGVAGSEARGLLGDLIWDDPETGALVPAAQYLSGNVRAKLAAARAAADREPRFAANVGALQRVLPRQLEPDEITARLGAPWIPPADVETFCVDVLGSQVEVEFLPTVGRWAVALRVGRRASVSLSSEWGTARADAVTLLDASLNQRLHTVTDETEDGRRVRNDAETIAAREKQDALGNRFSDWVWEDPDRAVRLAVRYNELFSSVVLPSHDGSHLTLPGLSERFTPRPHQRDAVARILTDGRALLAHAVGAGKTATMVMAAMELRRLGMVSKPAVVVPNHMLDQFTREWLQLYPSARILVADRDRLSAQRRREFVARCATGEWDAILFTHSGFGRVALRPETSAAYLGAELDRARAALDQSRIGKGLSVKRLERRIAQLEETYQRLLAEHRKDDGVSFDETGIDYVFCDESHLFKNRRVDSSIDGMGHPGSQRAQDLDSKLWALRQRHGERVTTFATATPVANSMAELWVMQTYLQPDVLAALDLAPFDAWAATFGRTVTSLELAPDGASYRLHTRFARFQNVPELMTIYRQVADVRTDDQLDLPRPTLAGGGPETVVVPSTQALRDFVADLAARAERVRNRSVLPTEDNMLKISGDGRRAALDLRLVGLSHDDEPGKLVVAAERIASIHHATRAHRYLDDGGEPHPRLGALQLVFCDASTPSGDGWNAYDELRSLLTARGVPPDAVCFIHEAASDDAKAKLFQACRDGRVAVLVGSTEKMGIGTNVQARAIALHHLDCPWRPADIEQRDGRIVRQGNQSAQVEIVRYVTEGSFDTYMWQTLERKAAFISQVTRGDLPDRDVDDIGEQALSYAEVKALATGNPLILEKAGVDNDVSRLRRLERAHHDDQHRLRRTLESARQRAARGTQRVDALTGAIETRRDTRGDRFTMRVGEARFDKRTEAGTQLRFALARELERAARGSTAAPVVVGELAGFPLRATVDRRIGDEVRLQLGDIIEVAMTAHEVANADPVGLIQRLERRVAGLDDALNDTRADLDEATREAERARARVGRPFEHTAELKRLVQRQAELTEALMPSADDPSPAVPVPALAQSRGGVGVALA
ncbi:MAG: DEAD/DEAH box helicase family protein [Acidimicrobiia bacterium]